MKKLVISTGIRINTAVRAIAFLFTIFTQLLYSTPLFAQQFGPKVLNLDDITLAYPRPWDREALVVLDFTVKSDGSIDDIEAVAGFHEPRFVDAAITAARQLQFDPATEKGDAVDWPGFRLSARFVYRDLFHTMSINANEALKEAEALMSDNKAVEAEALLKESIANNTKLYFEDAIFHLRLGEVYLATNRAAEAVQEFKLATQTYLPDEHTDFNTETARTHNRIFVQNLPEFFVDDFTSTRLQSHALENMPRQPFSAPLRGGAQRGQAQRASGVLSPKITLEVLNNVLLESAYQRAYIANITTGNISDVINTYNKLETLNDDVISEQMENQMVQVKQLQNAGQRLTSAQLIYNGESLFHPSHRILAAVNVNGEIETLDFQCESRVIRLPFQAEVEWSMPESWGQCALRFRGENGASFNLVEFPD